MDEQVPHPEQERRLPETPEAPEAPDVLEALIAELPVRRPSPAMDARVFEVLRPPVYALPWVRRASAVAAVVVIGLGLGLLAAVMQRGMQGLDGAAPSDLQVAQSGKESPSDADAKTPDSPRIEQVWVASEPTGRIVESNGSPMEELRVTELRHVRFTDEDGAAYEVAVPVQRVDYRPASFD